MADWTKVEDLVEQHGVLGVKTRNLHGQLEWRGEPTRIQVNDLQHALFPGSEGRFREATLTGHVPESIRAQACREGYLEAIDDVETILEARAVKKGQPSVRREAKVILEQVRKLRES